MLEADRLARNEARLKEMYPTFRVKIQAVLKEMQDYGYRPRIQEAWRSPEDQLADFKAGRSRLQYGFHNVTAADGTKEALAADMLDDDNPEGIKLDYVLHLAAAAKHQGLTTGVYFDLVPQDVAAIVAAVDAQNWNAKPRIGWDPMHVQITEMTPQEAQQGKRPPLPEGFPPEQQPESTTPRFRVENLATHQISEYEWSTAFKPVVLLPVPYVSQLGTGADAHKNDCGAASAVMLLDAYLNLKITPDEFYAKFSIQGDPYLSVLQIRNAMGSLGLMTDFRAGLTLQDLFTFLAAGKPVIMLSRYKVLTEAGLTEKTFEGPHFSVAVGIDAKYIYVHDPLYTDPLIGEAHAYPLDIFWQAWKAVGQDTNFPNPERSAIIPIAGLGFKLVRRVRVNIANLNVRAGAGLNFKIVGTVKRGAILESTRELNGWGMIGENRWVYLAYTIATQ